jgi:hypothetical protein
MKLPYLIFLLVFLPFASFSQVGIGTDTPAPGTALHIKDITGTSGVLFPKVNIVDLATVAPLPIGTEDGTIVYNTNTTTGEGYYYFLAPNWNLFLELKAVWLSLLMRSLPLALLI